MDMVCLGNIYMDTLHKGENDDDDDDDNNITIITTTTRAQWVWER